MISRRALLITGTSTVGLSALAWAGGSAFEHYRSPLPGTVTGSFVSKARLGARCGWTISYPPGSKPGSALPVVVALHGRGGTHRSFFSPGLRMDQFLAAATSGSAATFALAGVDGGDTYWHRRATGEDAAAMVMQEFLPLLGQRGLLTSRLGLLGYSMGGYGALRIGGQLGRGRVRAVVAESPALWRRAGDTAPGAFDDPADFAANTVFGRQQQLTGVAVRVDCGTEDGFCPSARAYAAGLSARPGGSFSPGGHDQDYWRRMAPAQLSFLGGQL